MYIFKSQRLICSCYFLLCPWDFLTEGAVKVFYLLFVLGGIPDTTAAAKSILQDWNRSVDIDMLYYCLEYKPNDMELNHRID